jgi:DNA-binding CsgD family transcriptional regulator
MGELAQELAELGAEITPALENVGMPAALLDREGIVRWQNAASVELTGSVVGMRIIDVVAPQERREAYELLTSILCGGEPADFTLRLQSAGGGYVLDEISAAPVRGGGSIVGLFGLGRRVVPGQAGVRRSATHAPPALTERQLEILRLLAEGWSTATIAAELALSPTTVRNHVAATIAALGVHTRLQAVVAAHRAGLLDL